MNVIQKLTLVGLVWCFFSCGSPENETHAPPASVHANRTQLTGNVNSIAGSWTIYSMNSSRTDTAFQSFRDQLLHRCDSPDSNVRVHLRVIDSSSHGSVARTIVSAELRDGSCRVQFYLNHVYCCEQMLRVTWESNPQAPQESSVGCSSRAFGMNAQALKEMITAGLIGSPTSRMPEIYHFTSIHPVVTGWEGRGVDRRWILLQNPAPEFTGQPIPDLETRIELVED